MFRDEKGGEGRGDSGDIQFKRIHSLSYCVEDDGSMQNICEMAETSSVYKQTNEQERI